MEEVQKIYQLTMGPAKCAVDLGDGSERGEYVNQDYILNKLGRPHRCISLMYCYYPLDELWPARVSEACKNKEVSFAWDYPYDDYFPYQGGIGGDLTKEPFTSMRDVRRHGQDVLLTITIDPHVSDEHLVAIAHDLRTFGRVRLRINHEATGNWFAYNKRCTYQEVADFFVRASNIIKKEATNVETIICIGGIEDLTETKIVMEENFAQTIPAADIWSVDKYMALHWGWPFGTAERGGTQHARYSYESVYEKTKASFERYCFLNNGVPKPMVMSEFNADGDVTGPYDQCQMVQDFCDRVKKDEATWFTGFTYYQFRDRGRLGLEIEDPNNKEVGIEQPVLTTYKNIIHDDYFKPSMTIGEEVSLPVTLRWGDAENSTGLSIPLHFNSNPHFCELFFEEELLSANLMLEINDRWFYKAPGVKFVDLMPAFFQKPLDKAVDLTLKVFAPPASGENDPSQGDDWMKNYYTTLTKLPKIRIEYEPVELKVNK